MKSSTGWRGWSADTINTFVTIRRGRVDRGSLRPRGVRRRLEMSWIVRSAMRVGRRILESEAPRIRLLGARCRLYTVDSDYLREALNEPSPCAETPSRDAEAEPFAPPPRFRALAGLAGLAACGDSAVSFTFGASSRPELAVLR